MKPAFAISTVLIVACLGSVHAAPLVLARHPAVAASTVGLTGPQVAQRSADAYMGLTTLTETVTSKSAPDYDCSSKIEFVFPRNLRVDGTTGGGGPFSLVSSAQGTWVLNGGSWGKQPNVEMGIAACTGISGETAATVPALLLQTGWGDPFLAPESFDTSAPQETVNGVLTYHIHETTPGVTMQGDSTNTTSPSSVDDFWIDAKTFLLVQSKTVFGGWTDTLTFAKPKLGVPIPASRFAKPAGAS